MTADEALARAGHYRQLARQMTDAQTQEGLLHLAAEYDAFAETIADEPVGHGPQAVIETTASGAGRSPATRSAKFRVGASGRS